MIFEMPKSLFKHKAVHGSPHEPISSSMMHSTSTDDDTQEPLQRPKSSGSRQQLRKTANILANRAQKTVVRLQERPPLCIRICASAYHKYGLKHVVLLLIFIFYIFFGALLFLVIESPVQDAMRLSWEQNIDGNRKMFVGNLMKELFNNSRYLIYLKGQKSSKIQQHIESSVQSYEVQLGIRWTTQKLDWDYWNAVLFAGTICTTIGYGHIYPLTNAGKLLTIFYSLGGIPLVLLLLQDFGKLLTVTMKYPWYQLKRCLRRSLRIFTKQPSAEIEALEKDELANLYVFDIPVPAAVALIFIWLWMCATIFCHLDQRWTFLDAFYFFFISLSTIGLGDLVPSSPHSLISMFVLILLGLSLVSMVINLLQLKMRKTYDLGAKDEENVESNATLGVIQCQQGNRTATFYEASRICEKRENCTQTTSPISKKEPMLWDDDKVKLPLSPDDVSQLLINPDIRIKDIDDDCDCDRDYKYSDGEDDVTVALLHF